MGMPAELSPCGLVAAHSRAYPGESKHSPRQYSRRFPVRVGLILHTQKHSTELLAAPMVRRSASDDTRMATNGFPLTFVAVLSCRWGPGMDGTGHFFSPPKVALVQFHGFPRGV